jgi:aminoglycoside phosphotransferase
VPSEQHVCMDSLPGGYTNRTRRSSGGLVVKCYEGADRGARSEVEHACLVGLAGFMPVPEVVARDRDRPSLTMREVGGRHGQALIEAGGATEVLRLAGRVLRKLQRVPVTAIPELPGAGGVVVHGDFGPQNLLIDDGRISALVDWEFAHLGDPIEDLAWAEWIVRTHHPRAVDHLDELHREADLEVEWPVRHAAMLERCRTLLAHCERHRPDAAELWRQRLRTTESWSE